jgi:transcriptional regulator PpsR
MAASADLAFVLGEDGTIVECTVRSAALADFDVSGWIGRRLSDTVTEESRAKIDAMIATAANDGPRRAREVNHITPTGDLPFSYSVVQIDGKGKLLALGRDLRPAAALQQRLLEAQSTMERDYESLRQAETRYRLMFQLSSDAVLVVDGRSLAISDANPAALALVGRTAGETLGQPLTSLFVGRDRERISDHLVTVRATGRADSQRVETAAGGRSCVLMATLFRQGGAAQLMVRLLERPDNLPTAREAAQAKQLMQIMRRAPEGYAITDRNHVIIDANMAFVQMAELGSVEQVRGQAITRWLGRTGVDISVLMSNLRERGSVHDFATVVNGEYGAVEDISVTAIGALDGEHPAIGFLVRRTRSQPLNGPPEAALPRSIEQMTELVGRMPLKEIVRDTTDIIEKLCIEAALKLTNDNRASAAQLLGVSRQSLYSRLRRHGFEVRDDEAGDDADN